ncbi:GGDEF domain-containing response regulator [Paludibaculum fermentans]|uniref:GGDEF domain-containing response regulator n=1 Tax=Paludibaculum fermentans TaxID=1473598 RepID=UPI001E53F5AD|nr:diguanylate cyclase [Paludibaculum fermentans]
MKILVADDSLLMRRLLESTLQGWGYEVVTVSSGDEAWACLQKEDAPPLAILDWMMPVHTGPELCKLMRTLARPVYTYIILLTSRALREDIVEGLGAGADDYVIKPFDKHELEVRLRAGRRIIDLQAELMRAQEALRIQATRDGLTRTWNRAAILEILDREVIRASRERRPLGVVMLDLDHFKRINDEYGHLSGDAALSEAARRVGSCIRAYDAFGRYGGEEFLVVVPGAEDSGLISHAERLRVAIEASPFCLSGQNVSITASFGACTMVPTLPSDAELLIRSADNALYEAKHRGRNSVVFHPVVSASS